MKPNQVSVVTTPIPANGGTLWVPGTVPYVSGGGGEANCLYTAIVNTTLRLLWVTHVFDDAGYRVSHTLCWVHLVLS